jgi:rod shape-determining protein MreB and related proteins
MTAGVADLGIDLGTTHTRIVARGRGLVLEVSTHVALRAAPRGGGQEVVAIGEDARKLIGRAPEGTLVSRPLRDGLVEDAEALEHFLRAALKLVGANTRRKRVVVCVASPLTDDARLSFEQAIRGAGIGEPVLVPGVFAAAVGAGLPVSEPVGSLLLDLGAGRSQVAVMSLGGIIVQRSLAVGGDHFDEAIGRWMRDHHQLMVADRTTETLKVRIGSLTPALHPELRMRIRGRELPSGRPRELEVEAADIASAVAEPLAAVRAQVLQLLRETPPELAGDLVDRGLVLSGGGAQLRGLAHVLHDDTGLPILHVDRPTHCVALGAERLLEQTALLDRVEIID